jgi:hypothetical protein
MMAWTKEKTLLVEQIRESNVWNIKFKECKDDNVYSDTF